MGVDTSTVKEYDVVLFTAMAQGGSTISRKVFFKVKKPDAVDS